MAYRFGSSAALHHTSFAFASVDVGSGTDYAGGWYMHESGANDFNPAVNLGTIDAAHGGWVYLLSAGGGVGDTTVQISGTSWDPDTATRTGADTEDLTILDGEAAATFHQSTKLWIGRVSLTKTGGPDVLCNFGLVSIWQHNHEDFVLNEFYAEWEGDGNDAGTDIIVYHHQPTGWTYNAGGEAGPPILYSMITDYGAENESFNDEMGTYQRHELSETILASQAEGLIIAFVQTGSTPYGIGSVLLGIRHP